MQMRISIIGAGRVAYHFARVLSGKHEIVQIYSRTVEKAQQLADLYTAQAITSPEQLDSHVDLVIIAVSDQSIQTVIQQVHNYLPDVLIVHTSGSTHLNVLRDVHPKSGVFYPLQTFSLEREIDWLNTPLFIEAHDDEDEGKLNTLANSLSEKVYLYSSEQRLSLHLAAVFACNFSNYCYDMAKQVVDAEQVDFSLLYPLMLETANKATQNDPKQMQTGPAMRGDQNILNMHQQMLATMQRADLYKVYQLLSQQILERHQK
ncbi:MULTISPECIES: Rossmann-like and DUF2520 domain-containing protein [unclassified Acinetobacter]|uniref:Rossmann-like and DUF2520 domain-containing protein n=1 Tax=unclassified Acinetobacter TaxID=196816 RepID=UPI00222878FD|nr:MULTISPECIES: F420-dependent NADP oxidoreductase [unclassified Acinetobacter]